MWDALDECSEKQQHRDKTFFVKTLLQLAADVPFGVKIFCTGRDEAQLQHLVSGSKSKVVDIPVNEHRIKDDIRAMVKAEIEDLLPELAARLSQGDVQTFVVEELVASAKGMFLLPRMMVMDLATIGNNAGDHQLLQRSLHRSFIILHEHPCACQREKHGRLEAG